MSIVKVVLGTDCSLPSRLVRSDCTKCERHAICHYSIKGEYPNADSDCLYTAQLELLELKQAIRKLIEKGG